MRWSLVLLALVACTPDSRLQGQPCRTVCGVRLFGSNDCKGFQAAEDRAVAVYARHYPDVCDRLFMFAVYVQPATGSWQSPAGRTVRGLTWCRSEVIQLGSDDWSHSSYAHELLHAAECGEVLDAEAAGHAFWNGGWQWAAVEEAK